MAKIKHSYLASLEISFACDSLSVSIGGALVVGEDAYRATLTSNINKIVSFFEDLGILIIHEPDYCVLDVCASLAVLVKHFHKKILTLKDSGNSQSLLGLFDSIWWPNGVKLQVSQIRFSLKTWYSETQTCFVV